MNKDTFEEVLKKLKESFEHENQKEIDEKQPFEHKYKARAIYDSLLKMTENEEELAFLEIILSVLLAQNYFDTEENTIA